VTPGWSSARSTVCGVLVGARSSPNDKNGRGCRPSGRWMRPVGRLRCFDCTIFGSLIPQARCDSHLGRCVGDAKFQSLGFPIPLAVITVVSRRGEFELKPLFPPRILNRLWIGHLRFSKCKRRTVTDDGRLTGSRA
jgi:hypothetical protein